MARQALDENTAPSHLIAQLPRYRFNVLFQGADMVRQASSSAKAKHQL